jgi:hypothetical protein
VQLPSSSGKSFSAADLCGGREQSPSLLRPLRFGIKYGATKLLASADRDVPSNQGMAEKVKKLNLERDYKKYLYFIDGNGNVSAKSKSGEGETQILVPDAVQRDNQYLYFIDKEGDIARSPRAVRRKKEAA